MAKKKQKPSKVKSYQRKKELPEKHIQTQYKKISIHSKIYTNFYLVSAIFCAAIVVIYSNTFNSPFVYDDIYALKNNEYIQIDDLSYESVIGIFKGQSGSNRPLPMISFAANYFFHKFNVLGYHIVNVIIHLITALMMYVLLKLIMTSNALKTYIEKIKLNNNAAMAICFFAALIWAVHPVQTNSVTYVIQRMNSMAAMFFIASFIMYIKGREAIIKNEKRNASIWFTGCAASGVASIFSKEIAATLPVMILIYEWYFNQDLNKKWFKKSAYWILSGTIITAAIVFALIGTEPLESIFSGYENTTVTPLQRLFTQFRVIVFYISLIFYPHPSRLNLLHSFPISNSLVEPGVTFYAFIGIVALISIAIITAKKERLISFAIIWFLGNLAIESTIIPLGTIYEHRLYLPSMMIVFATVILFFRIVREKKVRTVLFIGISALFSLWTYQRNSVWANPIALYTDCVNKSPNRVRAQVSLGISYEKIGNIEKAASCYNRAIQLDPDFAQAHNNLGKILIEKEETERAIYHFREAVKHDNSYPEAYNNLGTALAWKKDNVEEGIIYLERAIKLNPGYPDAHQNLGRILLKQGKNEASVSHFKIAYGKKPDDPTLMNDLVVALIKSGKIEDAIIVGNKALSDAAEYRPVQENIAVALTKKGRIKEAIPYYEQIVLNEDDPFVWFKIGSLYAQIEDYKRAAQYYETALELKRDFQAAHRSLGDVYEKMGNREKAIFHFQESLKIIPDDSTIQERLSMLMEQDYGEMDSDIINQ